MKTLSLVFLAATLLPAADLTGDWYGAVTMPNGKLRAVLHVTTDSVATKMVLDSIDQGAMGLAAGSASMEGDKLTGEWPSLGGRLEVTANPGGTELSGTWTQRGHTLPAAFNRTKFAEGKAIPLSPEDRDFLISHLEKSRKEFLDSIAGLSKEQWLYKPASGGWSIAECAEHLVTTEDALFLLVRDRMLKAPVNPEITRLTRADDEKLIATMLDRTKKGKAPEMLQPTGKYPEADQIPQAFNPKRDRSIEFVRTTQEDLRGRKSGPTDAYQYLLTISAHTLRHTAQLNEVKKDAAYPK
jgi:hypothetical protein